MGSHLEIVFGWEKPPIRRLLRSHGSPPAEACQNGSHGQGGAGGPAETSRHRPVCSLFLRPSVRRVAERLESPGQENGGGPISLIGLSTSTQLLMPFSPFAKIYARSVFYPTLAWNYLLGRILKKRRWWDRIDSHVIVGAYPFAGDIASLRGEGVRAVVNTCEEYSGPLSEYDKHGIEQLHIPTTDFTHPKLSDVEAAVEFIQKYKLQNDVVYIHCKAGRARSATVAICWLIKYRGMSIQEAQQHLLRSRPHINPRLGQREVVQAFARNLAEAT